MKKLFALILVFVIMSTVVSALAETWTCDNCGKESEGNFCSWCGTVRPPEKVVCPSCGAEFDPDAWHKGRKQLTGIKLIEDGGTF